MEIKSYEVAMKRSSILAFAGKETQPQVVMVRKGNKPVFVYNSKAIPSANDVLMVDGIVWQVMSVGHFIVESAQHHATLQVLKLGVAKPEGNAEEDDPTPSTNYPEDSDSQMPPVC